MGTTKASRSSFDRLFLTYILLIIVPCSKAFHLWSTSGFRHGVPHTTHVREQSSTFNMFPPRTLTRSWNRRQGTNQGVLALRLASEKQQETIKWSDGSEIGSMRSLGSMAAALLSIPAMAALLGRFETLHFLLHFSCSV